MKTSVALYSPDINLLTSHLQSTIETILHILLVGAVVIFPGIGLYLGYKRVG
jgi:hypothetical protein